MHFVPGRRQISYVLIAVGALMPAACSSGGKGAGGATKTTVSGATTTIVTTTVPATASSTAGVWQAPNNAFTIQSLPAGFAAQGATTIEDATSSPSGTSLVSQSFRNTTAKATLVVSIESGTSEAAIQMAGGKTSRTDVRKGVPVYVWTDANTQQRSLAWSPTPTQVVWIYSTGITDDALFDVARSVDTPTG
jgi:hypothetical protein